jgi:TRAP-type C4-dicarboxylate transport system substrate-binding protein
MPKKYIVTGVHLPEQYRQALEQLAKQTGLSKSELARRGVDALIEKFKKTGRV